MPDDRNAARRATVLDDFPSPPAGAGPVIRPLPPAARFVLRLDQASAGEVASLAGFRIDRPINSVVAGERISLRLGPDEWLLIGPAAEADAISDAIGAALGDRFHALVAVGHGYVGIEIAGGHAADALNAGCPLDLSSVAFPGGFATRTILGKAEVIVARLDDRPVYRVECARSFAKYIYGFLVEAARDF